MADFVAVLKKTIEGLGETTPDVRDKVYQKARLTIGAKLAALNPPASPAVIDRQRRALEEAIRQVEAEYAALDTEDEPEEVVEDPLDELDALFSSLSKPAVKAAPAAPREDPAPRPAAPLASKAVAQTSTASAAIAAAAGALAPTASPDRYRPQQPQPIPVARGYEPAANDPEPEDGEELRYDRDDDEPPYDHAEAYEAYEDDGHLEERDPRDEDHLTSVVAADDRRYGVSGAPLEPSRGRSGIAKIAAGAAAALIVFGGIGYGLWANRDRIGSTFAGDDVADVSPAPQSVPIPVEPTPVEQEEEIAVSEPLPLAEDEAAEGEPESDIIPKFTQRLTPDGSEVDDGPAGGVPLIGEGTSVAAVTPPGPAETAAPSADTAVPVGQRAIFYEERTSVAPGSAEPGATVWSLIQESPGNDLPPEPAIRAEANVPGRDIQLRMTIRRNADKSLPASHIVELIFITPDNFAGGAIDNVLRMTMKENEESAGSPLAGMTAKIADGFFLLALNDEKQARDANNALLRRQNWIDVPIVYKSGRRALMTMEKGIPGEQVFEQALRAWQEADSG